MAGRWIRLFWIPMVLGRSLLLPWLSVGADGCGQVVRTTRDGEEAMDSSTKRNSDNHNKYMLC